MKPLSRQSAASPRRDPTRHKSIGKPNPVFGAADYLSKAAAWKAKGTCLEENTTPQETPQSERQRPRSEATIRESEEWLFTTLQSIGDAVIVTDEKGCIVFMNPVAVRLTGWTEAEAQGKECQEIFHIIGETSRLETESPVVKVLRDGVISGLTNHTILISRNGAEYSIDDSGSPVRSKTGVLIGVVLIFRDITERRSVEKTYQEQKEILQTLFDHLPLLVAFMDEGGQFKWVNYEWQRIMGWSLYEAQHRRPDSGPARWTEAKWHDAQVTGKEGKTLDITWASVRLSDRTYIGIGQDITQRKQREADVTARNQRLEQAMRETDHRIKNNLQSIAALLDMQIMADADTIPTREIMQMQLHIQSLASIHDMLVRDVTDPVMPNRVSARDALQKLIPLLENTVGPRRIQWSADAINLSIKQGMSLAILVNELVCNAVKHGSSEVEVRLSSSAEEVTLEALDNGPGFDVAFDPRKAANFGVELIESVSRIDLRGQTNYVNRPEGGGCVRVTFPFPQQHAA